MRLLVMLAIGCGAAPAVSTPPPAAPQSSPIQTPARPAPPPPAEAVDKAIETARSSASLEAAVPVLVDAVTRVDEMDPRSVDAAQRAAAALGEARTGLAALAGLASKPPTKKLIAAQVAAVRAIGRFTDSRDKAAAALAGVVEVEPPPHPRTDKAATHVLEEAYALHLAVVGAAINALGELRTPAAVRPLLRAMYRTPELFMQVRRALAASGRTAEDRVRAVLSGRDREIDELFARYHLDVYCGDSNADPCEPVSAKDFYAAIVLGDFYDPASAGDLVAALDRPARPVYFEDGQPGPTTQHNAIFDALRKIGAPTTAAKLRTLWSSTGNDAATRALAAAAYGFVARDEVGVDELGKIAADNAADDQVRQEAAAAYARLATDRTRIGLLQTLANRYLDAAAKKRAEADARKPAADAATRDIAVVKQQLDDAKAAALKAAQDPAATTAAIRAATDAARKAEDAFKATKRAHREQLAPFHELENTAKAYVGFARMFQTHVARIAVAIRCKRDLACYAATLGRSPELAFADVNAYLADAGAFTAGDKDALRTAEIDRAMAELGKRGAAAASFVPQLLEAAGSEERLVRQAALVALPKLAPVPCEACRARLVELIAATAGTTDELTDLVVEMEILRNRFTP